MDLQRRVAVHADCLELQQRRMARKRRERQNQRYSDTNENITTIEFSYSVFTRRKIISFPSILSKTRALANHIL